MSSTSDSRVDAEDRDRDPYDADPVRNDPWATGPAHATQQSEQNEQTERFVPEQRDSDHDGHLYASDTYAEPETTVLPDRGTAPDAKPDGHHKSNEPTAVGVAHVDTDHVDTDKDADDKSAPASDDEPTAVTHDVDRDHDLGHDEPTVVSRDEPVVVVEPVAEPVAVAVVEPATDKQGELTAVPVDASTPAEEPATELKPGDVPVAPVAGFFAADAAQGLRDRWRDAQLGFVDDPRKAVEDVKALVGEAVDQFTAAVSAQRDELDAAAGDDTEQYRVAVQRYRAFFDRLLDL